MPVTINPNILPQAPTISGQPFITGVPHVGTVLVARAAFVKGTSPVSRSWVWGLPEDPLSLESTYIPIDDDAGSMVTVTQIEENALGVTEAVSAAFGPIQKQPYVLTPAQALGNPLEGQVLTGVAATYAGGAIVVTQEWQVSDDAQFGWQFTGNTTITYPVMEVGKFYRFVSLGANGVGDALSVSNVVGPVQEVPSAPVITGNPTISGTPRVDSILTANAAPVLGNPTPARVFRWFADGSEVDMGSNLYTPSATELGKVITVSQTETNSAGEDVAVSAGTAPVAAAQGVSVTIDGLVGGVAVEGYHNLLRASVSDGSEPTGWNWGTSLDGTQLGTLDRPDDYTGLGPIYLTVVTPTGTYRTTANVVSAAIETLAFDVEGGWQVQTTSPGQGDWIWARFPQGTTPAADGAGGWTTTPDEGGSFPVGAGADPLAIPETGVTDTAYVIALYQRIGAADTVVLHEPYVANNFLVVMQGTDAIVTSVKRPRKLKSTALNAAVLVEKDII
jgi:hypothetical protein